MTEEKQQEEKPEPSLLEKAKQEREALEKVKNEAQEAIKKLEELKANQLLSGTAGGYIKPEPAKPLTNKEYAEKVDKGEIDPWKV